MAQAVAKIDTLISKINSLLTENMSNTPRMIFVTARSGGGKTTLAENLKRRLGFIHFDVDQLSFGADPVLDSGKT